MESLHLQTSLIITLLAVAFAVGIVAERLRFPYSVALLLAALPLQLTPIRFAFVPALLLVFLPALIFEAAWKLDLESLRRTWLPITLLALPGVLLTASFVGIGLSVAGVLPFLQAFLLGSIVAATDPIAVIAIFKRLAVPVDLASIVEGESLFNDGIAVVLYATILASLSAAAPTPAHLLPFSLDVLKVSFGGAAFGAAAALLVSLVVRGVWEPKIQIVGTIVAAYGSYLAADYFHLSGIFAAIVAGIALRWFAHFPTSKEVTTEVDEFWAVLAFVANSLVFLSMGLRIEFQRILHEPTLLVLTIALMVVARLVFVYGGLPLVRFPASKRAWQHIIALSGIRGALSLALALNLPDGIAFRPMIIDAVFGVVAITLVAQGLAIGPITRRLKFEVLGGRYGVDVATIK